MHKKGFSLAEVLIVMLVVVIIISISAPLITKKRRNLNENLSHGKWACKYIDGELHSTRVKDYNTELPPDNKWVKGCDFPNLAKNVKYLWVELYGGGGGGSLAVAKPWYDQVDKYGLETPVPRDGEYDLSVYVDNSSDEKEWENTTGNKGGIYYTEDSDILSVIGNSSGYNGFCEIQDNTEQKTYASCKTYTPNDVCHYTGDSHALKTSNCISSLKFAGKTYCGQTASMLPPNNYTTLDSMLKKCQETGKQCIQSGDNIIQINEYKSCKEPKHVLPNARKGDAAPGLTGKFVMKKGESLYLKKVKAGETVSSGTIGGYKYKQAKNGDNWQLHHKKLNYSDTKKTFSEESKLVATFTGGQVGKFSITDPGMDVSRSYCEKCGKYENKVYPNSSKTQEKFYVQHGKQGFTHIWNSSNRAALSTSSYVYDSKLSITNQYFSYKYGCYGSNGAYKASLYPVSQNKKYEIKIGKGGQGAYIDDDGKEINQQNGGKTSFEWLVAEGGNAAGSGCTVETRENIETVKAGNAGAGGIITYNKKPERNYELTPEEDSEPKGRWKVEDAGSGDSGMVVVSW